jgi:hypothetical protein
MINTSVWMLTQGSVRPLMKENSGVDGSAEIKRARSTFTKA